MTMLARSGILLAIFVVSTISVHAMEFSPIAWNGHTVIRAEGEIVSGDADRLRDTLESVAPLPHGSKVVLIDSLGGSVAEALRMSQVLDASPAHIVVPSGSSCASACASILFIAGEYRTVEVGGRLGQHSCSNGGLRSEECNELIAEHAVENGVSYGSVAAFITYTEPDDILWFSREDVDCWGISRYPYTSQSGFEKSEPCVFRMLGLQYPSAQAAWRVDFMGNGYRAFLRPAADHLRELELSLFCIEARPGQLFLSVDIGGNREVISQAIVSASLHAVPVSVADASFSIAKVDDLYSRVTLEIPKAHTVDFLTKTDALTVKFAMTPEYEPIEIETYLSGSRQALIFAANHCLH